MSQYTFSLNELCSYLHIERHDIQQLVMKQEIPFEQRGGRLIFYKSDIDAWASQRILGLSRPHLTDYHRATTTSAKTHDLSKKHAIIDELLIQNLIETAMPAKTKPSVLRQIVVLSEKTELVCNPADLLQSLEARERLCSTAIPDGIALLHPRNHEPYMFEDSFILIARTQHPIPFGALDGQMTDIFCLICCQDDRIHLHVLARICMMCKHTKMLLNIRNSDSSEAVAESVRDAEKEIIDRTCA